MPFDGIRAFLVRSGFNKTVFTIGFGIEEHQPDVKCRSTKGKYKTEKSRYDRTQKQPQHQGEERAFEGLVHIFSA